MTLVAEDGPTCEEPAATPLQRLLHGMSTAEICDLAKGNDWISVCATSLQSFGKRRQFAGQVRTVLTQTDNLPVREMLTSPGDGAVLIVDAKGNRSVALFGDLLANLAVRNGWSGVIINGALRDVAALGEINLGVLAVGRCPAPSDKIGTGQKDIEVTFGGCCFEPGSFVVADEDGVVVVNDEAAIRLALSSTGKDEP